MVFWLDTPYAYTTCSFYINQLLVYGGWFSPASSTTNTGRHNIAEILLSHVPFKFTKI
jgi:hypothetical protein